MLYGFILFLSYSNFQIRTPFPFFKGGASVCLQLLDTRLLFTFGHPRDR